MSFIKIAASMKGGLADNKKEKDFDPRQLAKGIKVEMEHTNNNVTLFLAANAFMIWLTSLTKNKIIGFLTIIMLIISIAHKIKTWNKK